MSYEDKVRALADSIEEFVRFKFRELEVAKEVVESYKDVASSAAAWVELTAKEFYDNRNKFGLGQIWMIGACKETRLSALREAIRLCARRSLEHQTAEVVA